MSCTVKRHVPGAWLDERTELFHVRASGGRGERLTVELVTQRRLLFDSSARGAWACCAEHRTIARLVGPVLSGGSADRLLSTLRGLKRRLAPVTRESLRGRP